MILKGIFNLQIIDFQSNKSIHDFRFIGFVFAGFTQKN